MNETIGRVFRLFSFTCDVNYKLKGRNLRCSPYRKFFESGARQDKEISVRLGYLKAFNPRAQGGVSHLFFSLFSFLFLFSFLHPPTRYHHN